MAVYGVTALKTLVKNINKNIHFRQSNPICSSSKTVSVEESLISIFTQQPLCLGSIELQQLGSKLTPQIVEYVLKSLRDWKLAQIFFKWASDQRGFSHSCYTYNAMAQILSSARENAALRDLALDLSSYQFPWPPGAFGFFLRCLGNQGLVKEANFLFDRVRDSGLCDLNIYSYNCLLEVISKSGDIHLLESRLDEMRSLSWSIDRYGLTAVIQCYYNAGQFEKALVVFNELRDKGWVDQHILSVLVVAYGKSGEVDRALELIEWAEMDLKINLNEKTFYVLIHGFVRENRVDKALKLYDKMRKLGLMPDISIYGALIGGLCKFREVEKALNLLMDMNESGITPDAKIIRALEYSWRKLGVSERMMLYNSILRNLIRNKSVDRAYYLIKETIRSALNRVIDADRMFLSEIKPDTACFHTVIEGLCNANKLDMALELFHDMDVIGCKRSVLLYNNLINCLSNAEADWLSECFDLLNQMKDTEFQPTHFTYNCIFGCLCRRKDVAGALSLLKEMRICGHEPWIKHYTLLVTKLSDHGRSIEAYNLLKDMTKIGFLPNMIAYSAMVDGLININEVDHGLKLFREMCEQGYCPDVVAYNIVIKGLCKSGRMKEADEILNEILSKGLVPSVVTYNLLIDGWCKNGDLDNAVLCFSRMIEEEQEPNVITYTTLIDGYCNAGKPNDAISLWKEMESKGCHPNRIAYTALINGLCKCSKTDSALFYLHEMVEKELLPDAFVYKALIDAFLSDPNKAATDQLLETISNFVSAS